MENLFLDCSDSELKILYQQYKEYQKAEIVEGIELKKYRKLYEEERRNFSGRWQIVMMRHLLEAIADRWYNKTEANYE